jgi:hypothetical protein
MSSSSDAAAVIVALSFSNNDKEYEMVTDLELEK